MQNVPFHKFSNVKRYLKKYLRLKWLMQWYSTGGPQAKSGPSKAFLWPPEHIPYSNVKNKHTKLLLDGWLYRMTILNVFILYNPSSLNMQYRYCTFRCSGTVAFRYCSSRQDLMEQNSQTSFSLLSEQYSFQVVVFHLYSSYFWVLSGCCLLLHPLSSFEWTWTFFHLHPLVGFTRFFFFTLCFYFQIFKEHTI